MAGDPGIDLGPGLFQPGAQLIGRRKLGCLDQNGADEQLPVNGKPPPGPCPPVRTKAAVGEHEDICTRCSGHCSGGTSGARGQRMRLSQRAAAARIPPVERSSAIAARHRGVVKFAPSGNRSSACPPPNDAASS